MPAWPQEAEDDQEEFRKRIRQFATNSDSLQQARFTSGLEAKKDHEPEHVRPVSHSRFRGTFDPITLGHLDVIRRGRLLFEHLIVGIGVNPSRRRCSAIEERIELARQVVALSNVSVEWFEELTVQYVRRIGARVILRGLRTLTDMEYEFGMTLTNHRLDPEIETVFLMADGEYSHISSSLIKQVASSAGPRHSAVRPAGADRADHRQARA